MTANTPESQRAARFRARVRTEGVVPERVHGTAYGYNTFQCRCEPCREAMRIKAQRQRAKVRVALECFNEIAEAHGFLGTNDMVVVAVPVELWEQCQQYRRKW